MQYHMAHLAGMVEYVLEEAYLPASYRAWKHSSFFIALGQSPSDRTSTQPHPKAGLLLVAGGQYLRSQAMITAASNFSHDVAFVKADQHVLVTRGVYQYSRHPSYAAFFYWAVGTQVLCGNPICAVAFAGIVYRFFSQRIYCAFAPARRLWLIARLRRGGKGPRFLLRAGLHRLPAAGGHGHPVRAMMG
jgi:protein-S-isoprenylcysteine O-methyltransferase